MQESGCAKHKRYTEKKRERTRREEKERGDARARDVFICE